MNSIIAALKDTVSITLFNRGFAGKIFNDVKQSGAKVVMKNNTPECVLLSPDEYLQLMEEVNDARLLSIATERIQKFDGKGTISFDEIQREFGITDEDLSDFNEVELG